MIAKAIFTHSQIIVKRQGVRTGTFVKEYSLDFAAQSRSGFHPIIGSKLLDYLFFWVRKKKFIRVVKVHWFGASLPWNSSILIKFWECSATKSVVRIAARYKSQNWSISTDHFSQLFHLTEENKTNQIIKISLLTASVCFIYHKKYYFWYINQ